MTTWNDIKNGDLTWERIAEIGLDGATFDFFRIGDFPDEVYRCTAKTSEIVIDPDFGVCIRIEAIDVKYKNEDFKNHEFVDLYDTSYDINAGRKIEIRKDPHPDKGTEPREGIGFSSSFGHCIVLFPD